MNKIKNFFLRANSVVSAFWTLRVCYTLLPIAAGLDKFFEVLVNWDKYVSPHIAKLMPFTVHTFMMAVGVVEVVAGLLVAFWPRIGGPVVAAWLFAIILNLLCQGVYWDIALRDFGLMLGAVALAFMARTFRK